MIKPFSMALLAWGFFRFVRTAQPLEKFLAFGK
jgi:hypothetical protein